MLTAFFDLSRIAALGIIFYRPERRGLSGDQGGTGVRAVVAVRFHRLRQSGIDEELFDVIAGYEAIEPGRR